MATDQRIKEQEMGTKLMAMANLEEIEVGGDTSIDDDVVASIAATAAEEVEGVSSLGTRSLSRLISERVGGAKGRTRGVGVEAGSREAILDVELTVIYGFSIPEIVIKVRHLVAQRVLEMVGLITKEININVVGIVFPNKMPGRVD